MVRTPSKEATELATKGPKLKAFTVMHKNFKNLNEMKFRAALHIKKTDQLGPTLINKLGIVNCVTFQGRVVDQFFNYLG